MRWQLIVLAILLVAAAVVGVTACRNAMPSTRAVGSPMPTIVSAASTDAPQPVNNPDKHLLLSNESSTIDASGAIESVRRRTSPAVVEGHSIIVGKYQLTKDAHIVSTVPTDSLVWIVSILGMTTPSLGVEGLTANQMNFVVDANTGNVLVAYPTGWHQEPVEGGPHVGALLRSAPADRLNVHP